MVAYYPKDSLTLTPTSLVFISIEIQDPFGNYPIDLPLATINKGIRKSLYAIFGH